MKFEYRIYDGTFMPIISLSAHGMEEIVKVTAYVDTGASYSIFNDQIAEILGLKLEEGRFHEIMVGDGDSLRVYIHEVLVSIAGITIYCSYWFLKGFGSWIQHYWKKRYL